MTRIVQEINKFSRCEDEDVYSKKKFIKASTKSLSGYDGLVNLAILMSSVALLKVLLGTNSNMPSDVPALATLIPADFPLPRYFLVYPILALFLAYKVEYLISQSFISWTTTLLCHVTIISTTLALPVFGLSRHNHLAGLISNLLICVTYIVLAMKLVSYVQINKGYRDIYAKNNSTTSSNVYPANLTMGNLVYFWLSPSLIYCPCVAYSPTIRLNVVLKRLMELLLLQVVFRTIVLAMPSVLEQLVDALKVDNQILAVERFLTLSLLFCITWTTMAYLLFVSFLQFLAEVLQVQERLFFHSWWNASTMGEFWKWWNLPVHKWCVQHIYLPFLKSGWSKTGAMQVVFIMSAILHEYMVSCPIQIIGHFAFFGFLGQLPLCKLSEVVVSKCGKRVGNFLVWTVLVFGNSAGVVAYYVEVV